MALEHPGTWKYKHIASLLSSLPFFFPQQGEHPFSPSQNNLQTAYTCFILYPKCASRLLSQGQQFSRGRGDAPHFLLHLLTTASHTTFLFLHLTKLQASSEATARSVSVAGTP